MRFQEIIEKFDSANKKEFMPTDVLSELSQVKDAIGNEDFQKEQLIFSLVEYFEKSKCLWGMFYGPIFSCQYEDGSTTSIPQLEKITSDVLKYCEKRLHETNNPIMRSRYSGVLVEFYDKVVQEKMPSDFIEIHIDSIVGMVENGYVKKSLYAFQMLIRAFDLSTKTKKEDLITQTKKSIEDYDSNMVKDDDVIVWKQYVCLLLSYGKFFSVQEKESIICNAENRLVNLQKAFELGKLELGYIILEACKVMFEYYKKHDSSKITHWLAILEANQDILSNSEPYMRKYAQYQKIVELYDKYGIKKSDELMRKINDVAHCTVLGFRPVDVPIDISVEDYEMLCSIKSQNTEDVLVELACKFLVKKSEIEKCKSDFGVFNYITTCIFNEDSPGPIISEDDEIAVCFASKEMNYTSHFLSRAFDAAIESGMLTVDCIIEFLYQSPCFHENRKLLIKNGLEAYFSKEHMVACHLLVPQLEAAIRNLLYLSNGNVLKSEKSKGNQFNRGFQLKTLDDILRECIAKECMTEDLSFHFRVLLTDQKGLNIRNKLCHGMYNAFNFNELMSVRIIQAMLIVGLYRINND